MSSDDDDLQMTAPDLAALALGTARAELNNRIGARRHPRTRRPDRSAPLADGAERSTGATTQRWLRCCEVHRPCPRAGGLPRVASVDPLPLLGYWVSLQPNSTYRTCGWLAHLVGRAQ